MAEHAHRKTDAGELRAKIIGSVAQVVRWIGLLIMVLLVAHVILTVGGANPANGITTFVRDAADTFVLAFKDLFTPSDEKLRVLVNYGCAAIAWLIVSSLVTNVIRRLGAAN
jgi:predicted ferric reductase